MQNGVIYLFHVGAKSTDFDALVAIIDGLRWRGYTITSAAGIL